MLDGDHQTRDEVCRRFDRFFNLLNAHKQTGKLKLVELNPTVDRDLVENLRHLEGAIMKTIQVKKLIKKTKPANAVNLFGQLLGKSPRPERKDSVRLVKGTTLSSLPDDSQKYDNDISDSDMTSVDSGVGFR